MTTHLIGKATEDHDCAASIAANCYAETTANLAAFFRELGGVDKIPSALTISDNNPDGWHGAEAAIDKAVLRGDWVEVDRLCGDYKLRVARYLGVWRARIAAKANGRGA